MSNSKQYVVDVVDEREFLTEARANDFVSHLLDGGLQASRRWNVETGKWLVKAFKTNEAIEVA